MVFRRVGNWLYGKWIKVIAVLFIIAMAIADFLSMDNLFTSLDLRDTFYIGGREIKFLSETTVYSLTLAVLLEGNPAFMGYVASLMADKTQHKRNDEMNAKVGFIISLVGFFFTLVLVCSLRYLLIYNNGGFRTFFDEHTYGGDISNNGKFIAQIYLLIAPVLTSLLSFVASWTAFRSEQVASLERKLDALHNKYLVEQSRFLDIKHRNDDACNALWSSLAVSDEKPSDLNTFRRECFKRIRNKLICNCSAVFPDQVERYNKEVECLLNDFIKQMGRKTTDIPQDIQSLTIDSIIKEHDKDCEPRDAWSYVRAGSKLEEELKRVLDNAVVVAQFKTAIKPYHRQGDY